jgi:opacity protein-like surface antigen
MSNFKSSPVLLMTFSVLVLMLVSSLAVTIQAQQVGIASSKAKHEPSMDVSYGMFGQLTSARRTAQTNYFQDGTRSFYEATQGTSNSVGMLGTLRQSFRPWLGYSINLGYSRFSEEFSMGFDTTFKPSSAGPQEFGYLHQGSIGVNMYEVSSSYVVQGPKNHRVETFAQLGGGVLAFQPVQNPSPYWVMFRPVMTFGSGLNYNLSQHWALRAEYRGLFYKNPDFTGASSNVPTSKFYNVTSEPTISVVYRFGKKH